MNHYQSLFSLEGKVAMITGSAQGIGAEVAEAFGDLGARVVVSDRDETLGSKQVAEFQERGVDAFFVRLDVTSEDEWQRAIDAVEQQHGRLDVLVNNAGVLFYDSIEEMSMDRFHFLMSVNVDGVLLGSKYAARLMKKNATADNRASIINLSSLAGLFGSSMLSAYSTSKGAVRLLTKSMAAEFGPEHIRVNSIHPGLIATAMQDDVQELLMKKMGMQSKEEAAGFSKAITPLQAFGTAGDVAAAIAFMASGASNFLTGTELVVDGGISAVQ